RSTRATARSSACTSSLTSTRTTRSWSCSARRLRCATSSSWTPPRSSPRKNSTFESSPQRHKERKGRQKQECDGFHFPVLLCALCVFVVSCLSRHKRRAGGAGDPLLLRLRPHEVVARAAQEGVHRERHVGEAVVAAQVRRDAADRRKRRVDVVSVRP